MLLQQADFVLLPLPVAYALAADLRLARRS